ncbi:hypothetical protein BDEG_27419 [Batrachochytrium dendrobatidis JEL423]|uniref:Uncharacterized protein n=1 Tax=Batrachochytrium dendrobatidis (strain JEL423) TaxID=403673 RepID=A0A177WVR4_BATDL|nr:hypothetical protein BDEG_27419 [Batrachochytrium dendrobatidis JEL423]
MVSLAALRLISSVHGEVVKIFQIRQMDRPSDDPSPTTSDSSGHSLMDAPGYIKPDLQDLLLTDITAKELRVIAETMEVDYLGPAVFPGTFPAMGNIKGQNYRLMVPLVCRRRTTKDVPSVNIIFLIDTGSPVTYLCHEAMEVLIGKDSHLPQSLYVKIHSEEAIEAHLSPKGSHFADSVLSGEVSVIR